LLSKLKSSADQLKMPSGFKKSKLESSHPEIVSGSAVDGAVPGTFEIEVQGLARSSRQLSFGFPDADKTEVGFGFMRVGLPQGAADVEISPGSTLKDVAAAINDKVEGVRASVINTGFKDDPFRLLVSSIESGENLELEIDPDTTFTEFKSQVKPQDLKLKFEGVDVKRASNALTDLVDGVSLKASKAAPGTAVTVTVAHDVDRTADGVREFVNHYNEIQAFAKKQTSVDAATGRAGQLSGDGTLRQVSSSLQRSVAEKTLTSVGIATDAKTGELRLDESKLKEALAKDYEGVAAIFSSTQAGPGLAAKMSDAIKALQDRTTGAVATKLKGLDERIRHQDDEITRKEERLSQRKAQLERTFASLDAKMATMKSQGQVLSARLGPTEQPAQKSEGVQ
jgi:flagellar hook-associated protein 2